MPGAGFGAPPPPPGVVPSLKLEVKPPTRPREGVQQSGAIKLEIPTTVLELRGTPANAAPRSRGLDELLDSALDSLGGGFVALPGALLLALRLTLGLPLAAALDNGVGRTPPLGWSSWNHFAAHISSDILKQAADAMASNGLRDAGFEYINLGAQPLPSPRAAVCLPQLTRACRAQTTAGP